MFQQISQTRRAPAERVLLLRVRHPAPNHLFEAGEGCEQAQLPWEATAAGAATAPGSSYRPAPSGSRIAVGILFGRLTQCGTLQRRAILL